MTIYSIPLGICNRRQVHQIQWFSITLHWALTLSQVDNRTNYNNYSFLYWKVLTVGQLHYGRGVTSMLSLKSFTIKEWAELSISLTILITIQQYCIAFYLLLRYNVAPGGSSCAMICLRKVLLVVKHSAFLKLRQFFYIPPHLDNRTNCR